ADATHRVGHGCGEELGDLVGCVAEGEDVVIRADREVQVVIIEGRVAVDGHGPDVSAFQARQDLHGGEVRGTWTRRRPFTKGDAADLDAPFCGFDAGED